MNKTFSKGCKASNHEYTMSLEDVLEMVHNQAL